VYIALAAERESNHIDKMAAEELSRPVIAATERKCPFQISKQQPKGRVVAQAGSCEGSDIWREASNSVPRN
jgi:hypothetical protein